MSIFWLNNIHFAIEFFGAIALVVAAWFAFDAFLLTREKKALLKVFGFGFFGAWQAMHALDVTHQPTLFGGVVLLLAGLFLLALNIQLETPPARPNILKMVFVIPGVSGLLGSAYVVAGVLACGIVALSARRFVVELNKPLRQVWIGFGLLGLSFFAGSVSARHLAPDAWWVAEHALRIVGFGALTLWVWQYLTLRLKESLLLIFVAMALLVSLVVTFTFSALLLSRMRADAARSLQANARVFSFTLKRLSAEAKTKSVLASSDAALANALAANDFAGIEERVRVLRAKLQVDFVTVADAQGAILQRATYRTSRGETIASDPVASGSLAENALGDVAVVSPEGLSVRGASYIIANTPEAPVGVVITGFLLDNVFLDAFKNITGLDVTLLSGNSIHASTIREESGGVRLATGAMVGDASVMSLVLNGGREYTGSVPFFGRPHLASFLPLHDAQGSAVGVIVASRPEVEIAKAAVATNRLTLLTTLAIVLALLIPAYLVVRRLTEETER